MHVNQWDKEVMSWIWVGPKRCTIYYLQLTFFFPMVNTYDNTHAAQVPTPKCSKVAIELRLY